MTDNYDDILRLLEREAVSKEDAAKHASRRTHSVLAHSLYEDARLLREAMEIVRERRFAGNRGVEPPQEMDLG